MTTIKDFNNLKCPHCEKDITEFLHKEDEKEDILSWEKDNLIKCPKCENNFIIYFRELWNDESEEETHEFEFIKK